jgi:hypothetical protein
VAANSVAANDDASRAIRRGAALSMRLSHAGERAMRSISVPRLLFPT